MSSIDFGSCDIEAIEKKECYISMKVTLILACATASVVGVPAVIQQHVPVPSHVTSDVEFTVVLMF